MQAGRIIMEGERSIRRVLATTGTVEEGLKPSGRVAASVSAVAKQGERSDGGVLGANGVAKERLVADGRVAATLCVAKKGEGSVGRVAVADSVAKECPCARWPYFQLRCSKGVSQRRHPCRSCRR